VEVIIIDGYSNDSTLEIIKNYQSIVNICISESDNGIYDAMNKAIKISKGEFLYFLGADDKLLLNCNELRNVLIKSNTIYYGDVITIPTMKVYDGEFTLRKVIKKNICHQSIFYPANVFKKYSYNNNYKLMADYILNLQLWADSSFHFQYINKIVSEYNIDGLSSNKIDLIFKRNSFKIIFSLFGLKALVFKFFNIFINKSNKYIYEK